MECKERGMRKERNERSVKRNENRKKKRNK
jgi:hypothetical protein